MYHYIVLTEDLVSTQPKQENNSEPTRGFLTSQFSCGSSIYLKLSLENILILIKGINASGKKEYSISIIKEQYIIY